MHPLLDLIERTASTADLADLKTQARFLEATPSSHADIEDELLRPAILSDLPKPAPGPEAQSLRPITSSSTGGLHLLPRKVAGPRLPDFAQTLLGNFGNARREPWRYGTPGNGESASCRFH